ncbi:MAG: hypothetical protein ACK4YP_12785 [Myxococcota bacterium]
MTRALLPLLLLSACAPGKVTLSDELPADDTAADGDTDTATGTDTAADTGSDTGADTDTGPVYEQDFSEWNGTRRFVADYSDWGYSCDDEVEETGEEIEPGSADWDALSEVCGICDRFYEVTPSEDSVCDGYISLGTTWRGVVFSDDAAAVYFYRENDGDLEEYAADESADFDGETIDYAYDYELYSYFVVNVTGDVTWPLVEAD